MSWYKVSDGRVVYAGALTREPVCHVDRDARGDPGDGDGRRGTRLPSLRPRARRAVAGVAGTRRRRAQRRGTRARCRTPPISTCARSATLAYAQGLPRTTVALRRLVLVPRALVAGRARSAITARLAQCHAFAERPRPAARLPVRGGALGRLTPPSAPRAGRRHVRSAPRGLGHVRRRHPVRVGRPGTGPAPAGPGTGSSTSIRASRSRAPIARRSQRAVDRAARRRSAPCRANAARPWSESQQPPGLRPYKPKALGFRL